MFVLLIRVTPIDKMVEYHLKVMPIVYKYIQKEKNTGKEIIIYMIKSISRENHSYNVVNEDGQWICDCPSYKYKSGTDSDGHCKHIRLIIFMLDNNVEIPVI